MAIQNLNPQEVTQVSGGLIGGLNLSGLLGGVTGLIGGLPLVGGLLKGLLGALGGLLGGLPLVGGLLGGNAS